jgi:hypothetical protein
VYVRQPTAAIELMAQAMMIRDGAIAHDRLAESRAWRMAQCLCDREGARLVGDDQLDQLLGLSKADFEELDNAIDRAISMEDVLGNSAATQS